MSRNLIPWNILNYVKKKNKKSWFAENLGFLADLVSKAWNSLDLSKVKNELIWCVYVTFGLTFLSFMSAYCINVFIFCKKKLEFKVWTSCKESQMPLVTITYSLGFRFQSWCRTAIQKMNSKHQASLEMFHLMNKAFWLAKKILVQQLQNKGCWPNWNHWFSLLVAYPYAKNQHQSSIQSWCIADLILGIT